jgi:prevent-host-death family protein
MYSKVYISAMSKEYSVAEARKNLPAVLDEVASGVEIQLTRRGRPIAVLVSVGEYEKLKAGRTTFAEAYREFRQEYPETSGGTGPAYFRKLRARSPGRKVAL